MRSRVLSGSTQGCQGEKDKIGELKSPSVRGTRKFGAALCKIGVCSSVLRRSRKGIYQHPGVGRLQVLCLQKDNLLRETIIEILKRFLPLGRRQ